MSAALPGSLPRDIEASAAKTSVEHLVLVERVRLLYANLRVSQAVTLLNGVVLAGVQATVMEPLPVAAWLGCLVLVTALRLYFGLRFARATVSPEDIGRWQARFGATAVASGAVWGAAAWLLYPPDLVVYQVFIAFTVGGMVAGAVALLTPVFGIFVLYALCALLPTTLRFLLAGDHIHVVMGGMGFVFLVAMLFTGRRIHATILQALTFRFENRELVEHLTSARQHLQATNSELLAAQETLKRSNENLESRVAERTAALENADRRKDEFLAMLSHELRNPLAAICSSIYLFRRVDPASANAVRAREIIDRQAHYLSRLVDDLLDVSRIARGKIAIRPEKIDLADFVRRTAEDHAASFEEFGVRLLVDVPKGPLWAAVDPTRVSQLIGNLLQNAAKFTPSAGRVRLELREQGDSAEIRVSDTGGGIEPELLSELFQPFVQGRRSLARTERGLGLGLALVKGIAELHEGSVRAQSEGTGRGASFTVRLPLSLAGLPREAPSAAVHGIAPNRRVLVVDDNRDAADSLALLVEAFGHSAKVAYDGASAIEMAHTWRPNVVLCDLGLPGITGYDVARALRAELKDSQLIAVTGYTRPEDMANATAAGFDGYVAKPPDLDAIRRLLACPTRWS